MIATGPHPDDDCLDDEFGELPSSEEEDATRRLFQDSFR
jgi:hypothetical protein